MARSAILLKPHDFKQKIIDHGPVIISIDNNFYG